MSASPVQHMCVHTGQGLRRIWPKQMARFTASEAGDTSNTSRPVWGQHNTGAAAKPIYYYAAGCKQAGREENNGLKQQFPPAK